MSYALPTLQDLLDRTRKAFRKSLPGSDAWVWPNNITPTAKVIAGAVFEVFGFAGYIAKMIFVSTAPDLETLKLHANEYGMTLLPAEPARGVLRLTSTGDLTVAAGAVFARTDGVQYVSSAGASRIGAGDIDVPVTAVVDGAAGNVPDGAGVTIVSGVTGDATALVHGDIVGGADVEDKESFRTRILFRKRYPPHGGAASDYVMWAREVSGVTRVFVERLWAGAGTVRVFVLMDRLYSDGVPGTDDIARVREHIEAMRPAGAIVTVAAPSAVSIDVVIDGFEPDTVEAREQAKASLREAFLRLGRVAGGDTAVGGMPFLATPFSFSRSWIWQAVANASGEERHSITTPGSDVALSAGQIPVLGNVTFS